MGRRGLPPLLVVGVLILACSVLPAQADDGPFGFLGRFRSISNQVRNSASSLIQIVQSSASETVEKAVRFAVTRSTKDEICFRILGCLSLQAPYVSLSRPLPVPREPEKIKVRYYLHSRSRPERFTVEATPPLQLEGSGFDPEKTTFFLTHGYLDSGNLTWVQKLKDALLKRVDGNVFIVDWGFGAAEPSYLQAVANTRTVARELAWLGQQLIEQHGASPQKFHLIGHSLGAHISGDAARQIGNVARVTGFDPAGPGFENEPQEVRLNTNSATFVDTLHTNAKPLTVLGFGIMMPIGHVDFYVNGAVDQPGCAAPKLTMPTNVWDVFKLGVDVVKGLLGCSHVRSYEYFTEALDGDCTFWGHPIDTESLSAWWRRGLARATPRLTGTCAPNECVPIGLDTPQYPARGQFSVVTDSRSPYCRKEFSNEGQRLDALNEI